VQAVGWVRGNAGREQAQGTAAVHRLLAAVDAELGIQVPGVGADGVDREEQLTGDIARREVGRQVAQDAGLAVGQLFGRATGEGPRRRVGRGRNVDDASGQE
jgi:hypothetical protein